MTTWDPRANDLFLKALELSSADERQKHLDGACAGDAALRAEVESLLEASARAGSFLESPALAPNLMPTVDEAPVSECPGTVIGPYKLLQQIGEGGMGTVYMAEQSQPIRRKVALKVIKPGMDSRQVIARFEAERQALAMMDHVNIARVLDGGTTEAGRPYFVMELVHGVPITKYCDDNHLTPRERLELFVPVCQAIQHAHQKGIIHRDIKPSNVMITHYDGKPVPKVIDFGVAKATEQRLTERTLFTQYGTMVGTLEYMSPEQAEMSALGVDTRSDIYSLGVLLYELLTGNTPLSHKTMKEAAYAEILRMIKEEEPPKPSTRLSDSGEALASISANRHTEPAKLTKLVRGELDWIVMKTLEKDRNRRYETAKDFAADVQRYLNDETVQACPPSAGYRLRKFARRNKAAIAVAGLVLFFLVLLGSGAGWAVRNRAAREAELARERTERQVKVAGQVELILDEVDRLEGEQKWPEALAAAKRAEAALAGGEADQTILERVRQVLVDLDLVQRLEQIWAQGGSVWDDMAGSPAPVNQQYSEALREAGIDLESLSSRDAADRIASRRGVAVALIAAVDDWAFVRGRAKDAAAARPLIEVAQAVDKDPWRQRVRDALLRKDWVALEKLATSEELDRQPAATLFLLAGALYWNHGPQGIEVMRRAQWNHPGHYWINFRLGLWLMYTSPPQTAEAISYMRVAVALRPQSGHAMMILGNGFHFLGRDDEAIASYRKAIELSPKYAVAHSNLGNALAKQKKLDEAIAYHRKAIELSPKYADAYFNLGAVLNEQGKVDEAIASYRKAIELDPKLTPAYSNLGVALFGKGLRNEAIAAYKEAIRLKPDDAAAHNNLGVALADKGLLDEASAAFKEAIRLKPEDAVFHVNLSIVLGKQGKHAEKAATLREAIRLRPNAAVAHNDLAWLLATCPDAKMRDPGRAVELAKKAVQLAPKQGDCWNTLGAAHYRHEDWIAALEALNKSMELRKGGDANDWYVLAMAHWKLDQKDQARKWYDQALTWMEKNAPENEDLRRFRAEAAELLGVKEK